MSEANTTRPEESETTEQLLRAVRYTLETAVELQKWSGHLDWSKRLVAEGVLKSPELVEAFSEVSRADFLPEQQKPDEGYDHPVGIGYKQTNSQPSLVGQMLELLQPKKAQNILDVGSGSAWTTALLARVVQSQGHVIGTERIEELVEFGNTNLSPYGFSWARVEHTESGLGFPEAGPYDHILVSAHMLEEWVPELTEQLSPEGGKLLAPIAKNDEHGAKNYNQSIVAITRQGDEITSEVVVESVGFVPLIHASATS